MATYSRKDIVCTNCIIPKYVPDNLKWYEKDGLHTWYLKGKCDDFLRETDYYFQNLKVVNFDMIRNELPDSDIMKYKTVDFTEIESYSPQKKVEIKKN